MKSVVYILSILMGVNITYWGMTSYLENCEIREEGVEVEVVMLKPRYSKKSITQIKYKGKVYDWHGGKGKIGQTYTATYSTSKDKFLDIRQDWYVFYFPISLGVFFTLIGIYGIIHELFFTKS